MSTITATVTAGQVWTADADGKTLVTKDKLNNAAVPTVTSDITDSVDTADIKQDAIGVDELSDAVADLIPKISISVAAEDSNNIDVTFTIQDAKAETLADQSVIEIWLTTSTTTLDPNVATFPDGGAAVQGSGVEITAAADDTLGKYITPATGIIVIRFNHTVGALSGLYPIASIGGKTFAGSVMTWS